MNGVGNKDFILVNRAFQHCAVLRRDDFAAQKDLFLPELHLSQFDWVFDVFLRFFNVVTKVELRKA